ncbi:MAG TPA: hypothetical protein VIW94_07130 [Acidimicrobiia bacterium]
MTSTVWKDSTSRSRLGFLVGSGAIVLGSFIQWTPPDVGDEVVAAGAGLMIFLAATLLRPLSGGNIVAFLAGTAVVAIWAPNLLLYTPSAGGLLILVGGLSVAVVAAIEMLRHNSRWVSLPLILGGVVLVISYLAYLSPVVNS